MKHKYLIAIFLLLTAGRGIAQEINFYSAELDSAIRVQLGIAATEPIVEEMTDTITTLDLQGLEISDIRDLVYFPSLENLNLAYNGIRDISPLTGLRNLRYLNIQSNFLETVDLLAFSESLQMTVILSSNYITDFYAITHSPQCLFSIIGMNLQYPYNYEVRSFYTDYDLPVSEGIVTSDFWSLHARDTFYVENSGLQYQVLPDTVQQQNINATGNLVYLTAETQIMDSTWFVPPVTIKTENNSISLAPEFPVEDYTVLSVETLNSNVEIRNDSIVLIGEESILQDTVKVAFGYLYPNGISRLKGYTYFIVGKESGSNITENKSDNIITIYPNPASNFVNITCRGDEIQLVEIYSQTGQKYLSENQIEKINISSLPIGTYIIRIYTANGKEERKLIKR